MEENNKPEAQKEKKKKVYWVTFVIVFLFIICGIVGAALGTTPQEEDKPTPEEQVQEYSHNLGDMAEYNGLAVTLESYEFKREFLKYSIPSSDDDSFCIVKVKVHNTTNKTIELIHTVLTYSSNNYQYQLIYDNNFIYNQSFGNDVSFLAAHDEIKPLATINAHLCFKVPNLVKNSADKSLKIKFQKNKNDAKIKHYWTLR